MKRYYVVTVLLVVVFFCGCNAWMNGNYASVTPHKEQNLLPEQVLVKPKTYEDVVQILENMIQSGQQRNTISMERMEEGWQEYLDDVIDYVKNDRPIGAYAVSEISYDIGTNNGEPSLSVDISYRRSIADIDAVMYAENIEQMEEILHSALRSFSVCVTVCIEDYGEYDFEQMVENYAIQFPQYVIETPRVSTTVYPRDGEDRIVELVFNYETSRTMLRQMQEQVSTIFSAAQMYVSGDGKPIDEYAMLYSFLMNRYNYTIQASVTPAYSLLYQGVGDSKAVAAVFSAMCHQAGLNCEVISGKRSGEGWYWNAFRVDNRVYYIDLLRCQETGGFSYKTAQEMTQYDWDYSAY